MCMCKNIHIYENYKKQLQMCWLAWEKYIVATAIQIFNMSRSTVGSDRLILILPKDLLDS